MVASAKAHRKNAIEKDLLDLLRVKEALPFGQARSRDGVRKISGLAARAITMGCGDSCPVLPGKRYEEWILADPNGLGVESVRPIRNESRTRLLALLGS